MYYLPYHGMVCVRVIETGASAHGNVRPREPTQREAFTMLRPGPMSRGSKILPYNLNSILIVEYC